VLISSINYIVFLAISFLGYGLVPTPYKKSYLLFVSVVFCSFFGIDSVVVVTLCIAFNFIGGARLEKAKNQWSRKRILAGSILVNISLLAFYKYTPAVSLFICTTFDLPAPPQNFVHANFIVPVGISFYIFQSISYLIEVYRGKILSERSVVNYSLYILFFPKLLAGPIERPDSLIPQFRTERQPSYHQIRSGFVLILWGLFQKIVIADRLAVFVNAVYSSPQTSYGVAVWIAIVFYSFQIYCDFNGYTDIARGTAKIFGYELSLNFRQPYLAKSVQEFWRRWHISLSVFLRDYIYIPLKGGRAGNKRKIINILAVFIVCGIWHGSSLTFLLWGMLHGLFIILELITARVVSRGTLENKYIPTEIVSAVKIFSTFLLVSFAWVLFRADSIQTVITLINNGFMFTGSSSNIQDGLSRDQIILSFSLIFFISLINIIQNNRSLSSLLFAQPRTIRWAFYYTLIFAIILLPGSSNIAQFIYYKF
jgi:alginate O-acetyltransferase complex protein AlgI